MGLGKDSTGRGALEKATPVAPRKGETVVALAGNPNVGKSTVFNALTGLRQHTGNWPGKTVMNAAGHVSTGVRDYCLVDIPGTYSLLARSAEEEVARRFLCFGGASCAIVVCDATCLSRNLNLVLQTMELMQNVIVCVNLLDEAKRKGIIVDTEGLSERLGVPVVGCVAQKKKTLDALLAALDGVCGSERQTRGTPAVRYDEGTEAAVASLLDVCERGSGGKLPARWLALRLLEGEPKLLSEISHYLGGAFWETDDFCALFSHVQNAWEPDAQKRAERIAAPLVRTANALCKDTVAYTKYAPDARDRRVDRVLTGRVFAYPVMLLLLCAVFWLTIVGANYPSAALSRLFSFLGDKLEAFFLLLHAPSWLRGALFDGVYRVLTWVVSVMLPPMAIFFPLFTLLEDVGYLPRVAYNLDRPFHACRACGKQSLCMCMSFGCNAAGVVGARIIDSPRERLLAILTANFIPCNGRFPILIALVGLYFAGVSAASSLVSSVCLTAIILLSVLLTFCVTKLLASTLLRGLPSSFLLEMPPYRRPQVGKILVRSLFDRTLFVLGRAVAVAAPAGLLIWLCAHIPIGDSTLLLRFADGLDPIGRLMGMDGVLLTAFLFGFPANEIVLPLAVMIYTANGTLSPVGSLAEMKQVFDAAGWTSLTAASAVLFTLMHWPCSTTVLTVAKETKSVKWTLLSVLLPTVCGVLACMLLTFLVRTIAPFL